MAFHFSEIVFATGDRGEPGDKGAKGYGLPGHIGEQGPEGNVTINKNYPLLS